MQKIKKKKADFDALRFSKKIIVFTMGCTIAYAVVYLILCFTIQSLPDYSFNAGIFAALSAENICNAWIKVKESNKATNNLLSEIVNKIPDDPGNIPDNSDSANG
jgi:hypothetical protein